MHSLAMMNGQLQQVGPPLQASRAASHLPQDATRNQQVWSGNNSHYYRTFNSGVQPSHTPNAALHNNAYSNRQMANGQSSAGSHQAVYSQNKYGQHPKDHLLRMLLSNTSLPSANLGSGNSSFTAHYTSIQNQSQQNANTSFTQHDLSLFWKPSSRVNERHSEQIQDSKIVTHLQQSSHQGSCQNVSVDLNRAAPAYSTTAASVSHQPFNNPSTSVSTSTHSRQMVQAAHNQIPPQSGTECRFSQSYHQQRTAQLSSPHNRRDATTFNKTNPRKQYENGYLAAGTNVRALNPPIAPQQVQRHRLGAHSVVNSSTSGSDCRLSYYRERHLVTVSNPNIRPVTSLPASYSSGASQPSSLHCLKSVVESNILREQHSVNLSPQQNLMPDNNVAQKRSSVGSRLNDPSQPMQGPHRLLSQRNNIESLIKTFLESPDQRKLPSAIKPNDSSVHSTPGHTNTRAVAVVPPLSQKSSNTANCDSPVSTEKELMSSDAAKNTETAYLRDDAQIYSENTEQIRPSKVVSNDGAALKTSHSGPQHSTQISKINTTIAKDAPKSLEMPAGQSCPNQQTPVATSPSACALELSTLPVTTWTFKALTDLIVESEIVQKEPKEQLNEHTIHKIMFLFWNKNPYAWLHSYKEGWHKDLLSEVFNFCTKYVKKDTVILSQVKQSFEEELNNYHVLKDEAYSEEPYKSSWLNVNYQLDDIDKEFGFPWVLKHHLASDSLEPVAKETQNKIFSQREPESIHLTEVEQGTTSETLATSPATSSELKRDNATDSCYSFKIQVLSPEAAKVVYEEVQNNLRQSPDSQENTPQIFPIPQDLDVIVKDSKMKTGPVDPINEVCCLARLMEMNSGLSTPSFKCLCKGEQSDNECSDKTSSSDSESPVRSKEDIECQIITFSGPKLCKEIHDIIDLTGSDDVLCSSSYQETEIISLMSNDSQPNIETLRENENENEDEDRVPVLPEEMTHFEGDCVQVLTDVPSSASVSMARQTRLEDFYCTKTKVDSHVLERNEDCGQARPESADVGELPEATEGQADIGAEPTHAICGRDKIHEKKRKSQSNLSKLFSSMKESKKSKLSVDLSSRRILGAHPSLSEAKTAELVLFGSAQQKKCDFSGNRKGYSSCLSYVKHSPPEVLSVDLDPLKINSTEMEDSGKSVKQRLYEKWRKSIPNTSGHRKKRKRSLSAPLIGMSPKRAKQPVSSETSDCNGKQRRLKRRLSLPNKLRCGKVERRRYSVTLEQPAKGNGSSMTCDRVAARPSQDNIVLKFSVLPRTFSFDDGKQESDDSVSGEPELEEGKEQSMGKGYQKPKEIWWPHPEKQFKPLRISKNISLFHEYQKKYKEKTRSSADE